MNSKYGLYATHLSNYIAKDIPVTKVFEEVGKCKRHEFICIIFKFLGDNSVNLFAAIDTWLKGTERNQIPMFALTITKPFRLTDAIYKSNYINRHYLLLICVRKIRLLFHVYCVCIFNYCRKSFTHTE